jgi:hypothetical protein
MCRRPGCHLLTVVGMTTTSEALTSPADDHDVVLRLATSAYLGRYTGTSRIHTASDLRLFFAWCTDQHLAPLALQRAQIERYVRCMCMQKIRRFKPSTVSRRMAVVTAFYRTCVIGGVVEHSPADYVRRPLVPAESLSPQPSLRAPAPGCSRAGSLDVERAACTGVRCRASPARGAAYREDSSGRVSRPTSARRPRRQFG